MGLFFKKEKGLLAVSDGVAIPLSKVPDEAFSSGVLGIGFAVEPKTGTVYCPADGRVDSITETKHAYTILTDDGLDLLVHIGIDTVELDGKGFLPMVAVGDRVKAGDVLARVDLDELHRAGKPTVIPVLITNPDAVAHHDLIYGEVLGGKTEVLRYRPQK